MVKVSCLVCEASVPEEEQHDGICTRCRIDSGLRERMAPTRPERPCAKCNGMTFVRARMRERASSDSGDWNQSIARPSAITFGYKKRTGFFGGPAAGADPSTDFYHGAIDAYVCRKCGYTELYADRPADIPIGEAYGTELIEYDAKNPYR